MNKYSHLIKFHDGSKENPQLEKSSNGTKEWWLNEVRHRKDGPAIECSDGDKYWFIDGKLHREDGPAVEYSNGYREWWIDGKPHREDGPAVEYVSGRREWWVDGTQFTEEEFNQWLDKQKLNEKLQTTLPHKTITKRGKI